jgi:AraC-like DNA-binding protein
LRHQPFPGDPGFQEGDRTDAHAYLIQRRIDLVRSLIAQGHSLAAAAAAAGFADQSHMTRAFRIKYGLTPGAYARALSA